MSSTCFSPGYDRVVILPDSTEEVTESGLYMPNKEPPQRGSVVAVGPGELFYYPGDVVIYGRYSGTPVKIDGVEYLIMRGEDVLTALRETADDELPF